MIWPMIPIVPIAKAARHTPKNMSFMGVYPHMNSVCHFRTFVQDFGNKTTMPAINTLFTMLHMPRPDRLRDGQRPGELHHELIE